MLAIEPHPLQEQRVLLAAERPPSPSCLICKLTSLINFLIGSVIVCILEPRPRCHDRNVSVAPWQLGAYSCMACHSAAFPGVCPPVFSVTLPALGILPLESIVVPG